MALARRMLSLRCIRPRITLSSTSSTSKINVTWNPVRCVRLFASENSDRPGSAQSNNATQEAEQKNASSQPDLEKLNADLSTCKEQLSDMSDKYKRALADAENTRRRFMKQVEDAKIFGIQSFCKDLLEVADVLQKATESVPAEQLNGQNVHLKNLYQGLQMTHAELQKVFGRHGLVPINPVDEKFNPNFHEALFQQPAEGKESGTVVVVSKVGYKLHERVIRPALVGVAK